MNYIFNRQPLILRISIVVVLAFIIFGAWFLLIDKTYKQKKMGIESALLVKAIEMKQLKQLEASKQELVYKNDISGVSAREALSKLVSSIAGLKLTNFKSEGVTRVKISNPASRILKEQFNISVKDFLIKDTFTINFIGDYAGMLSYLSEVNKDNSPIFIESVDYKITAPPKALITIKAFSLEES